MSRIDNRCLALSISELLLFYSLLPVHEAVEDFAGPELIHLSDHTDAHVSVSAQQPSHVFPVTWRTEYPNGAE